MPAGNKGCKQCGGCDDFESAEPARGRHQRRMMTLRHAIPHCSQPPAVGGKFDKQLRP
jgi:hypothetical protein